MVRESREDLLCDMLDHAGIGVVVLDPSGRVLSSNSAFRRIVGYAEEELPALDLMALVHPDDRVRAGEGARDISTGFRDRLRIERRFVRKDGVIRWGRATVSVERDAEGRPERVRALLEDVTDQHEVDGVLRHAEEICASIAASSPDYIMILDLDGRIRSINRTMAGMSVEGVVGTTVLDYIPERFWPEVRTCIDRVVRTAQEGCYEVEYPAANGKVHTFASRVRPVRRDGKVAALVLCATDVTNQRLLERQLLQAQKLESIGRLAGGIAHDLNNQLSIIMGSTELARRSPDGPTVAAELLRIEAAGERAASLTRQLLAFGRKQALQTRLVGLNSLVAGVRDMVGRIIGDDIELRLRLGRVGQVRVDPVQIEQVLLNLVINARDAMPQGGTLLLSTEEVAVPEGHVTLRAGTYALLTVTDTGIGMDRATLSRLFEPFFTTKEEGKGTGLGLAVAHGIVTQSGGHIEVESAPGAGATFRVHLPVAEGVPGAAAPADPAEGRAGSSATRSRA